MRILTFYIPSRNFQKFFSFQNIENFFLPPLRSVCAAQQESTKKDYLNFFEFVVSALILFVVARKTDGDWCC